MCGLEVYMFLDSYEINKETLLILPLDKNSSKVYENNDIYIVNMSCFDIICRSCLFFGSSYEGRSISTKDMINSSMKLPIIIEESNCIIFFPTCAVKSNKCIWVNYTNILKFSKIDNLSTLLIFKNNVNISLDVKYNILDNQIIRCIKLETVWKRRKKVIN